MVENEKVLAAGIEMLQDINLEDAETVQINKTKYDDGSVTLEVSVSFPAIESK